MNSTNFVVRAAIGIAILAVTVSAPVALAQPAGMDPEATKILRRMTDYLAGLKQFSVDTQNTLEVVTTSGQKLQFDGTASATVQRPNRLRAERKGETFDQVLYYDGKSLSLHSPGEKYYATVAAPTTLDAAMDFSRDSLDVFAPASDLLYGNAYELLMRELTGGFIVGKSVTGGVKTTHLAFSGPEVDVQIWVEDGEKPLPRKYVVTSKRITGAPAFIVTMNRWNLAPKITDRTFTFTPPKDAKKIEFYQPTAVKPSAK